MVRPVRKQKQKMWKWKKKGDVFDIIFFAVIMFGIAVVFVISYKMVIDLNDNMQDSDALNPVWKSKLQNFRNTFVDRFDAAFAFVFAILAIGIFVAVWNLRTHPVMFWMSIILVVFIGIIAAVLGNAFSGVSDDPNLSSEVAEFHIIPAVMGNYLPVVIIVAMIAVIVAYAKMRST